MVTLIIRDLDDALLIQLKKRAWYQGLPLEESLRRLVIESAEIEPDSAGRDASANRTPDYGIERRATARQVALHS